MAGDCMQLQRTMRLTAMQEYGHTGNSDMRYYHGVKKDLPTCGPGQPMGQEINYSFYKSAQNDMYSIVTDRIFTDFTKCYQLYPL